MRQIFSRRTFSTVCSLFLVQAVLLSALFDPLSLSSLPAVSGDEINFVTLDICHAGSSDFMLQADAPMMCESFAEGHSPDESCPAAAEQVFFSSRLFAVSIDHPPRI